METQVSNLEALKPSDIQGIVSTISTAIAQTAASQEAAQRVQAETSLKHAQIQAITDREKLRSEDRQLYVAAGLTVVGLLFMGALVWGAFVYGKPEVATHAITGLAGIVGGWFVGKNAKR